MAAYRGLRPGHSSQGCPAVDLATPPRHAAGPPGRGTSQGCGPGFHRAPLSVGLAGRAVHRRERGRCPGRNLPPEWWAQRNLRPVIGPGRPVPQQSPGTGGGSAARRRSRYTCTGPGRVARPGYRWATRTARPRRFHRPRRPVPRSGRRTALSPGRRQRSSQRSRRAGPAAPWRTVVVAAGGFPEPPDGCLESGWYEAPRPDWDTWHEIHHSGRSYLPLLQYGDYGILPAGYAAQTPASGNGGPSWGLLRYTTTRSFFLAKVLQRGEHRDAINRDAARRLTRLADFRPSAVTGEGWLRERAQGSVSTGNHSVWN
ncbi:beta family protein [Streptomyces sp. HNM1019]|uniref:beta family protein n=1 Tax=Streptomyces sp. HNM1019 TaxID=3424717 RepID=UPI003D782481